MEVPLSPEKGSWVSMSSSMTSPDLDSGGEALLPPRKRALNSTSVLLYRAMQNEEQELCLPTDLKQVPRPTNPFTLYGSENTA